MKSIIIIISLLIISFSRADEACTNCHVTFESSCGLQCTDCHNSSKADYIPSIQNGIHPAVIQNPSDERWWNEKCLSCHKMQINAFKETTHYSAANIIGQTRYLWGKTDDISCESDEWKTLISENAAKGHSPAQLIDNLLAKKCLSCHFASDAKNESTGKKRNSGCAACHIPLDQNSGKPLFGHKMQKAISDTVCLTCHNGNHVGADYYGYFEQDYHTDYSMPYGSKPIFGAYQYRLSSDVHQQAGLNCTDCHRSVKTAGHKYSALSCEQCHGGFNQTENTQAKKFNKEIIAHKKFHKNISCSACHAQWSYQDYGLHLFLDESNSYDMWANTVVQGDYQVTLFLNRVLSMEEDKRPFAESANRLSAKISPGIWYKGWTFRRWEEPVLGINENGKYSIIRPLYQYFITYVDSNENVWLDSKIPQKKDGTKGWAWDSYSPHTIGKSGRNCESCHGNSKAAGLGIRQNPADSVSNIITLPAQLIAPGARILNQREIDKLLNKSSQYKKWRALEFKKQGIDKLFNN